MKTIFEYIQKKHINSGGTYKDFLNCLIEKPTLKNQHDLVMIVSSDSTNNKCYLNINDLNRFTRDELLQHAQKYLNEEWFMLIMYANQENNTLTQAYAVDVKDGNTFSLRKDDIYGENGKAIEKYFDEK